MNIYDELFKGNFLFDKEYPSKDFVFKPFGKKFKVIPVNENAKKAYHVALVNYAVSFGLSRKQAHKWANCSAKGKFNLLKKIKPILEDVQQTMAYENHPFKDGNVSIKEYKQWTNRWGMENNFKIDKNFIENEKNILFLLKIIGEK